MVDRKRWVGSLRYMFNDFFEAPTSFFKRNSSQMENKWEHVFRWVTHRVWAQGWRSAESKKNHEKGQ